MAFSMPESSRTCSGPSGNSSSARFNSTSAPCRHSHALHFSSCTKGCRAFQVFSTSGRSALIRFFPALRAPLADTALAEEILHEAPSGERRLEQVCAHERGEPQPVYAVDLAQRQTEQDECPGDQPNPPFKRHGCSSSPASCRYDFFSNFGASSSVLDEHPVATPQVG